MSNWIVESNKGDRFIFLIGRLQVHARSLDGGSCSGADDEHEPFDAACALAEAKQAERLRFRELPGTCLDKGRGDGIRQPQRLDEEMLELASFATAEAATEYLRANFPEPSSSR